ncbi:putative Rab6-interacting protein 2/elks/erc/cast [Fasciola gigantica]|uniref:Putative Rab6-interacting protein 2/elks/erc/cast n=1 Tax=Fasciola gigantica TaxID=46835 RepID=A0A504Y9B4_FASGI|nr:putative Rab6-interacting protein 2/elks/erc/cast [Fasciola gigantica]
MQAQLRRFEEEAANLNKVLDEQRAGLEERDRLIRQLRSNQVSALPPRSLEALTASLCEKEANIALMELTAPKNAASNQALEKLRAERDQLQVQQRQLSNTRAMLAEERKMRK